MIRATGLPAVNMSGARRDLQIPQVHSDNAQIGWLVAGEFLGRGFRHFGFVGMPGVGFSDDHCQGFVSAIEKAGFGRGRPDCPRRCDPH